MNACKWIEPDAGQHGTSMMSSQPRGVAVIDDDPLMLKALMRLLGASGFAVAAFESAEAFLACDAACDFGCLVLDISLSGMSGIELARHLAASEHRVPIIFMTAVDDGATHREAIKTGCVAFLAKPFAATALVKAIRQATASSP
jgi:FixJ family two-component response regulator